MSQNAVRVRDLHKRYDEVHAVRGIDLDVEAGEIFALLGPNGAGKTTTVEILEGHRTRTSGDVAVLGHDPARRDPAMAERIGIVLQATGVEPYLTVEEVLEMYRGYYSYPRRLDDLIEISGLGPHRAQRVNKLSGGQKRRLDVAIGLAGDPDLLFLDEPTTGFDPSARRRAWEMIKELAGLGKTVFLTTHYMDEAQFLADRVAIMAAGKIVASGDPGSLVGAQDLPTRITFSLPPDAPSPTKSLLRHGHATNGRIELSTTEPMKVLHELTAWALRRSVTVTDLHVSRPTLEDLYLDLTADAERREE